MSLSETSIRRPVSILMLSTGVVILGIIAFRNLSVDFLPPVRIPRLTILTAYADASPEDVEASVTQPIETVVGAQPGVKKTSSISREGSSVVLVEFAWGTDMDFALLDMREKLDQVRIALPRDAGRPTMFHVDPAAEPIMTVVLSVARGPGVDTSTSMGGTVARSTIDIDLIELKEVARSLIKRRIEQVEGVAQASVLGGIEREINVTLEMQKLAAYGLSLNQVSHALAQSNISLPGGTITQGFFRYPLRALGELSSLEEIRDVVAGTTSSGRPVRVRDIGTVLDTIRERQGFMRYNGSEVIALEVRKASGRNTVDVSRKIHSVLDELRSAYPRLRIGVFSDQAQLIDKTIAGVEHAMVVGAVLAFSVLLLFLRRSEYPVIIGLTMPVSVIATFLAMYLLKIGLNVISLTGLALGIGMLGDNATIMIENISRLREGGRTLIDATLAGTHEISLAVTASTLTNVAIFLPIVFVKGAASQLFIEMGATMTISLLVSLIFAVTLVPMLVSRAGRPLPYFFVKGPLPSGGESWYHSPSDKVARATYRALERYLLWALEHRILVIIVSAMAFCGSAGVACLVPVEPAPDIDQKGFTVQVNMPRGTAIGSLVDLVAGLEREILALPDVYGICSAIGITDDLTLWTVKDASIDRAVIDVRLDEQVPTGRVIDRVRSILERTRSSAAGAEFAVKQRETTIGNILRPGEEDVRISIRGSDLAAGVRIAREFTDRAARIPGFVDGRMSMGMDRPEYRITVDRDAAYRHGLSVEEVVDHLAGLVRGHEATSFSGFDERTTVRVLPGRKSEWNVDDILSSTIVAGTIAVPVRTLIRCEKTAGFSEIRHEERQRTVVIVGNIRGRSIGSVVDDLQKHSRSVSLPAGSSIVIGGTIEESRDSLRSLLLVMGLSVLLVYMILAAEYESLLSPLVILLTSPLAFVGAILSMVIAGQGLNIMSMIGIVIMIGAVDNDAVIAVDMIATLRRKGMPVDEAIRLGMRSRLRPILMTTATTVLGVVPLVFGFGTGSAFVQALTVPLVGGMIASTFFTIVTIPVVFSYVDGWTGGDKARR